VPDVNVHAIKLILGQVSVALDDAVTNGYEDWIKRTSDALVAQDLVRRNIFFEDCDPEYLTPLVAEWRQKRWPI
jgi:hypothetical protein